MGTRRLLSTTTRPHYKFKDLYSVNHQGLRRLPIPDLNDTLDRYVRSLQWVPSPHSFVHTFYFDFTLPDRGLVPRALVEPAELQKHLASVERFRKNEGPVLHKQIVSGVLYKHNPFPCIAAASALGQSQEIKKQLFI
jgi:hypothetical protein